MKKIFRLAGFTAALYLLSSALATDYVTESNLTGLALPKGAIEVTDQKAITPMAGYLDDIASGMKGECEYSEFLVWLGSDPDTLATALGEKIVAAKFKEIGRAHV